MSSQNIKIYKYMRGDSYSVKVAVMGDEHTVFTEIVTPPEASAEVKARLLDDAEREALKMHNAGVARKWSSFKS